MLAFTHIFGAHMGWEDRATAVPAAERSARAAIRADSEDSWAHLALAGVYPYLGCREDALAELEWALLSIQTSRWHTLIMVGALLGRALAKGTPPRERCD